MKAVLISIRPEWVEKIVSGKKTIEVRKTKPSIPTPFKAYIYCCKAKSQWRYRGYEGAYENSDGEIVYAQQHVIGEFICDKVSTYPRNYKFGYEISENEFNETALTSEQFVDYGNGGTLYGLHITDLKIYDKPKELSEFKRPCSYKGLCFSCKRAHFYGDGSFVCTNKETRPPQSWCYVQKLEEMGK